MVDERTLNTHLSDFVRAVKKLGETVNKSGIEWTDAQFVSLSDSIRSVAAASKQIIVIGTQCSLAVKRFNSIESE